VKHDAPSRSDLARAVGRLLRTWDPAHPVLLSSFDPRTLLELGRAVPERPRAQIVHRSRYHDVALRLALPAMLGGVNVERTIASPERVRELRARGLSVGVWTVNHAGEARDLAALGVDAIITDDPASVLDALGRGVAGDYGASSG
jgi:glycerophosphoryl diester phosphodiesterase